MLLTFELSVSSMDCYPQSLASKIVLLPVEPLPDQLVDEDVILVLPAKSEKCQFAQDINLNQTYF